MPKIIDFQPTNAVKLRTDADPTVGTPQGAVRSSYKGRPRPFVVGASSLFGSYPGSLTGYSAHGLLGDRIALSCDWMVVAGDLWTAVGEVSSEVPEQETLFDGTEYDRSRK